MEDFPIAPPSRHRAEAPEEGAGLATTGSVRRGPRFAPLAGAPTDYADVFGGAASAPSVHFDLPGDPEPTAARGGMARSSRGSAWEYATRRDMFMRRGNGDEIESWSASSRYGFCPF
ncbi:hypothetical protein ZWY2020_011632 [Hordeum vulgare]|nr:hypothetical protein ZWY2020_011632 [Hordeum vulgare]